MLWKMKHLLIMSKCSIFHNVFNSFQLRRLQSVFLWSKSLTCPNIQLDWLVPCYNRSLVRVQLSRYACVQNTFFDILSSFLHQTLSSYHSLESSFLFKTILRVWWRSKDFSFLNTHVIWCTGVPRENVMNYSWIVHEKFMNYSWKLHTILTGVKEDKSEQDLCTT